MFLLFAKKKKNMSEPPTIEWKNFRWVDGTEGPWGSKEFQTHLRGGLIETGGLVNLEKMMVWVLRKELEYKVEKLNHKKVGGHAP